MQAIIDFFDDLFTGDKKEPEKKDPEQQCQEQQQQDKNQQKDVALKQIMLNLDQFDNIIDNLEDQLEQTKKQTQIFTQQKKKKKAMHYFKLYKEQEKKLATLENQRQVLAQYKTKIQASKTDEDAAITMKNANKILQDQQKINEQLAEEMENYDYVQQLDQEQGQLWDQIASQGQNNEELEKEYDSLFNNNELSTTNSLQIQQPTQVQQQQNQQVQKQQQQVLDEMLS